MRRWISPAILALGTLTLLGAASSTRPTLSSCGTHLPPNAQFSVEIDATWDRRPESLSSNYQIMYRNQDPEANHEGLTEETEQFGECVRAALGG
jgi:hypothetical protein